MPVLSHSRRFSLLPFLLFLFLPLLAQCAGGASSPPAPLSEVTLTPASPPSSSQTDLPPGAEPVRAPQLRQTLAGGEEGWLSSPAVADLDGDGKMEIIAARDGLLFVWHADGTLFWKATHGLAAQPSPTHVSGRIWGPPVVVDLDGDGRPEIAVGSHQETLTVWNGDGTLKAGWPKVLGSDSESGNREIRALAAGLLENGKMGLLAARTRQTKVPVAFLFDAKGVLFPGWPQLSALGGCLLLPALNADCFEAGTYNQNVGIADLDGDGKNDLLISYDNAYIGAYHADGGPLGTSFSARPFFPGVPGFHDPALAAQGWGPDGADRSEFTDSPPVVADLNGDGTRALILVGDHERAGITTILGNSLFVFKKDATRFPGFERPFETRRYHSPLITDDPAGTNIVDVEPAPAVADLDGDGKKEIVFPAYDGVLYAVHPDGTLFWQYSFADAGTRFATEPVIADLNHDGIPEILFATYETTPGKGALVVLSHSGAELAKVPLPGRGAMAAPTVADLDGDGELEILINLKDTTSDGGLQIYTVPGSKTNLLPWPTARGNFLRNGDATR
ncbi:MAG: VCBS repeat-containing protein [Nitrospirae bacterium]|nr:VCBS repeat-containing protein [Candidatus Manganitrophaceae bacterium]